MRWFEAQGRRKRNRLKVNSSNYELGADRCRSRWYHVRAAAEAIIVFLEGLMLC